MIQNAEAEDSEVREQNKKCGNQVKHSLAWFPHFSYYDIIVGSGFIELPSFVVSFINVLVK